MNGYKGGHGVTGSCVTALCEIRRLSESAFFFHSLLFVQTQPSQDGVTYSEQTFGPTVEIIHLIYSTVWILPAFFRDKNMHHCNSSTRV